jgi:hypothetical protein
MSLLSPDSTQKNAATTALASARSGLTPIVTSPGQPTRRPSAASNKNRLSAYSVRSNSSQTHASNSRPASTAFPHFHSHLDYTLVRDFAYPAFSPLHYGPQEGESEATTPLSEVHPRRQSDPAPSWDEPKAKWTGAWTRIEKLPGMTYGQKDGPPWSDDEDIQSPVVSSVRHRKHPDKRRVSHTGANGDGSEAYYLSNVDEIANRPGGSFVTYASPQGPSSQNSLAVAESNRRRDSHFAAILPSRSFDDHSEPQSLSSSSGDDNWDVDDSRYSRDYQFTIVSPDEEMHGKAVALFDFSRENENELPLSEGQIVLISYRHGEGWLVAQDPKSGESGLIPEEYVRLLRDIEGGWNGLMNGAGQYAVGTTATDIDTSEAKTPTQETAGHSRKDSKEYYTPVVSTFSTSREDFKEPWGRDKITSPSAVTPTGLSRRGSEEIKRTDFKKRESGSTKPAA